MIIVCTPVSDTVYKMCSSSNFHFQILKQTVTILHVKHTIIFQFVRTSWVVKIYINKCMSLTEEMSVTVTVKYTVSMSILLFFMYERAIHIKAKHVVYSICHILWFWANCLTYLECINKVVHQTVKWENWTCTEIWMLKNYIHCTCTSTLWFFKI